MKTFLSICLAVVMTNSATAATYEIPVAAGLKKFATFELNDFEKKIDGDKVTIKYYLPFELVGNYERIKLEGRMTKESNSLILIGKKAVAICEGGYITMMCTVEYENLEIDKEAAVDIIRSISKSPEEVSARIEVMRAFSTDPVGIINYDK